MGALDIHHGGGDNSKTIPLINADTRGLKALTTENAEERREKSGRSVAVRKVDDGRRKKRPIGWHSCIRIFFVGFCFYPRKSALISGGVLIFRGGFGSRRETSRGTPLTARRRLQTFCDNACFCT